MNTINDNLIEVNQSTENILNNFQLNQHLGVEYFNQFVKSEDDKEREAIKKEKDRVKPFIWFFSLVPDIHMSYIYNIIEKQFNNDVQAYINTIPLFAKNFTSHHKLICDAVIVCEDKKQRRSMNKKRKELMLFSAQLLGLCGKNRAKIINESLVKHYLDEMLKAEEFTARHRLVHKSGKILRLVPVEKKQKQKQAQILKISKCLSEMAKDKGYTYSLVTLTLPPIYHPRPILGENSFEAIMPSEAHHKLMKFWQLIRANLAKIGLHAGDQSIFGLEVLECHTDSCLHLHALLYHSKEATSIIHQTINNVANNHNKQFPILTNMTFAEKKFNAKRRVKFDIKLNDGRASGATYAFKYITKTTANYNDKDTSAVKNSACRFYYSARSFNFFGLKNTITKFNFLQANYSLYKEYLSKEIIEMFKKNDYYLFVTKYAKTFNNVYYHDENKKRKLLGVSFDVSKTNIKFDENKIILIEKRQYCIFEKTAEFIEDDDGITSIKHLDINARGNIEVKRAFNAVCKKQDSYDIKKDEYIKEMLSLHSKNVTTTELKDKSKSLDELYSKNSFLSKLTKKCNFIDDENDDFNKVTRKFNGKLEKLEGKINYLKSKSSAQFDEKLEVLEEDFKILNYVNFDFNLEERGEVIYDNHRTIYDYGYSYSNIIQENQSLRDIHHQFCEILALLE